MAGKKGYKRLKLKDFNQVKTLLKASVPVKTIAEITGRGFATTYIIKKANTFEDYKVRMSRKNQKVKRNELEAPDVRVDTQIPTRQDPMLAELRKVNEQLATLNEIFVRLTSEARNG